MIKKAKLIFFFFFLLSGIWLPAAENIDSLQRLVLHAQNDSIKQEVLLKLAIEIQDIYNEKAIDYAERALDIAKSKKNKNKEAFIYTRIGQVETIAGNFQKAIHAYKNALGYYIGYSEKHPADHRNLRSMAQAHIGLGRVYQLMGETETALNNYTKAEKIYENLKDKRGIAASLIEKGNTYRDKLDYKSAQEAYLNALAKGNNRLTPKQIANIYNKIAFTFELAGNQTEAQNYFQRYIRQINQNADPYEQANAYNELGSYYLRGNLTEKALEYFNDALQLAMSSNNNEATEVASANLSDLYTLTGNYKKALESHIIYTSARETNSYKAKREELKLLEVKNKLSQNEDQIEFAQKLYQEERLKNRNALYFIILITATLVIVLVLVFLLYRQNRRNKNVMYLLSEQNQQVQQKTEEIRMQNIRLEQINRDLNISKQKAEESTTSKSLFLANMSHEIRTPMNGIIGMANELKNTTLNSEQIEALNIITISAENLLTIINEILDFSKIESGKLELESIQFDLYQEIKSIISLLSLKSKEKGLELLSEIDPYVPRYLVGDPVRLKQVIINLVNNGLKFTEKGGVRVNIMVMDHISRTTILRIEVIDTGIGISENEKRKLFHSFSQSDPSFTRKYGGTGLGLAISKNLVSLMNGEIGVESELGNGSKFWFTARFTDGTAPPSYIPRKEPYKIYARVPDFNKQKKDITKNNKPENSSKNIPPSAQNNELNRVLLIEDNMINQKVAMSVLKKKGYEVSVAENGKVGFEKFQANTFDFILMDIMMPVMDGFEATRSIREHEKNNNLKRTKIIAMTANALKEDREKCLAAGMDDYISKPFKPQDLTTKLQ